MNQFHSFLIKARDPDQIYKKIDKLSDLASHVDNKLADWHKSVSDSQQAAICKDLFENMEEALKAAKSTVFEKLTQLENEKISVAYSYKSGKSVISRYSSRSRSCQSVYSQEDALIDIKARRAALEEKIKYSDAIQEQNRTLNKLNLEQELSQTMSEQAVYESAIQQKQNRTNGNILPSTFPKEKENLMQRYLSDQISTHSADETELLKEQKVNLTQSHAPLKQQEENIVFSQPAETTANPVISQLQATNKENKIYTSMFAPQIQTLNTKLLTQPQNTVTNTKPIPHSHTHSTVYQNLQQTGVPNFAPTASNTTTSVDQIAEALAKVTQLQRLPQAKPDIFTGEEKDIKFFI